MKDLFPDIGSEERTQHRDTRCGTCNWYDGIMDQCTLRGNVRKIDARCVGWSPDREHRHERGL